VTVDERLRRRRERHRQRSLFMRGLVLAGGFGAMLGGIALLVLPGPGIPLLAVGLGLLSLEFDWAVRMLSFVLKRAERVTPERRMHRIALGTAAALLAIAGVVAAFWVGLPGF
jgi:putative transmembrane protein PGPGW